MGSDITSPAVSIVMPVFNGADYLDAAIQSALAQTYSNFEVLVVNDGSTDDGATERVALSYGNRIRYFSQPNGGVGSALNLAISQMRGEYFSWLSHDDLYCPNKLASQLDALSKLPEITRDETIIYSDYAVFSLDTDRNVVIHMRAVPPENFRYWITVENSLHGCTLLIPRKAFEECGHFDESLRTTQDYDLWFRMAEKYRFQHIPEVLVRARCHVNQGSIRMAETALREGNALLSGFVHGLTRAELMAATKLLPVVAYAKITESFLYRGFSFAAYSAARLACQNFREGSFFDVIKATGILMVGLVQYVVFSSIRKYLSPRVRLAIKAVLRPGVIVKRIVDQKKLKNLDLKKKFSEIYDKNIFGGRVSRSGEGSDLVQTALIRFELPRIVKQYGIKTFLDAPCGDWCWMKETELGVDQYIGVDIVETMIKQNRKEYGNPSRSFLCLNIAEDSLPKADLIFSRDCLVHLTFEDALEIIANFKKSGATYLLTTTFVNRTKNNNLVGKDLFWRPLNMRLAPFYFPEPLLIVNEGCTEEAGQYTDKSLGLWLLSDIET
jgi:glycosyltransferase involved in cell wall biosynthesis